MAEGFEPATVQESVDFPTVGLSDIGCLCRLEGKSPGQIERHVAHGRDGQVMRAVSPITGCREAPCQGVEPSDSGTFRIPG